MENVDRDDITDIEIDQLWMICFNDLHQEVHQRPLVVPVLGVPKLGQIRNMKSNRLFISRARIHNVAKKED